MKRGPGRGEEKLGGRQRCPSALLLSLLLCPRSFSPSYFLLSTSSTYSFSVSSYKFPSAFTPASICTACELSSCLCSSFFQSIILRSLHYSMSKVSAAVMSFLLPAHPELVLSYCTVVLSQTLRPGHGEPPCCPFSNQGVILQLVNAITATTC